VDTGDIIAAVALLVAGWAAWKTIKIEQKRDVDRIADTKKAIVTVNRQNGQIVIQNAGPAHARDVRLMLDGRSIADHPAVFDRWSPIEVIGPGASYSYTVAVDQVISPVSGVRVEVRWTDDSDTEGVFATILR
jgi:hypothetical protein